MPSRWLVELSRIFSSMAMLWSAQRRLQGCRGQCKILAAHLIAYEQQRGFTRLRMLGAKWLDVKEGTDEIDRLVRAASSSNRAGF